MGERNLRLLVEYEGTRYLGMQSQQDGRTIQDVIEKAIWKLTQEKIRITAAGRTDAGVHARGQVVSFRLVKDLPLHKIGMGLNSYLPKDIVVKRVDEVSPQFHARFSAKRRIYQYFISVGRTAISRNFCWQLFQKIDVTCLQPLADLLVGEHDFSAFSRQEAQSRHKICYIYESQWKFENDLLIYRIAGNRFLHGMVRTLVGTMIDVARGKLTLSQFEAIFHGRDRNQAGGTAPAKGLILEEVIY